MCEVSSVEDWLLEGVGAPEEDPPPRLGPEEHGDDRPGVPVGQGSVHLPQGVRDSVGLTIVKHNEKDQVYFETSLVN